MPSRAAWASGVRYTFPTFQGNAEADVVIVGGGLTGVTSALMLTSLGARVILLEKDELGCGATLACTGKLTAQQPEVYAAIQSTAGTAAARTYARLMQECVQDVRALIERLNAICGLVQTNSTSYVMQSGSLGRLRRAAALEDSLGLPIGIVSNRLPSAGTRQAVSLPGQYLLEPLPYLSAMVRSAAMQGCAIYEHSPVLRCGPHRVETEHGVVRAAWVVLATGYPSLVKRWGVRSLMQEHALEARVLQTTLPMDQIWLDAAAGGINLRPIRQGVLLSADLGPTNSSAKRRIRLADQRQRSLFQDARERERLRHREVFSLDGLPLIGPVHPSSPQLLIATAYSGWGLTGSMLSARMLSGRILGRPATEAPLFDPKRRYPSHPVTQLHGTLLLARNRLHLH